MVKNMLSFPDTVMFIIVFVAMDTLIENEVRQGFFSCPAEPNILEIQIVPQSGLRILIIPLEN